MNSKERRKFSSLIWTLTSAWYFEAYMDEIALSIFRFKREWDPTKVDQKN